MDLKRTVLFFCAVLFLTGCATHMPASEGIIFTPSDESESDRNSFWDNVSGESVSGISRIVPFPSLEREARDQYGSERLNSLDDDFLTTLPLPSFAVSYSNRFAIGTTVPLLGFWQLDGTVRLSDKYFLTLTRQLYFQNTQVVLQRKVLSKPGGGLCVGAFYRYDPMQMESEDETATGSRFYLSWFGVRSLFQVANNPNSLFQVRGVLNGGYVPKFKSAVVTFGISVNLNFFGGNRHLPQLPPGDGPFF